MANEIPPSPQQRRRSGIALVGLAIVVHAIFAVITTTLATEVSQPLMLVATINHWLLLAAACFVPLALAAAFAARPWLLLLLLAAGGLGLVLWSWADGQFYAMYGYRLDGRTWRLMTTPGAGEILDPGQGTAATIRARIVVQLSFWLMLVVISVLLWYFISKLAVLKRHCRRCVVGLALAVLLLGLTEQLALYSGWLSSADISQKLGPLHLRLVAAPRPAELGEGPYPDALRAAAFQIPDLAPGPALTRPHIFVLALEGARADYASPEVMPAVHRIAADGFWAERHFSTGTTTRYGVFGLFYGASGLFNEPVEAAGQASLLLRYLHGEGYHSRIYGVTVQTNPPFHRTAFREAHFRKDRWNDAELGGRMYRDRAVTDAIIADIEQLSASAEAKPLFTYAIYDASHYPFLAPDEFALSPGATPLDQVDLLGTVLSQDEAGIRGLAQRYRNSLRYLDHEIARIDAALAAAGLRDDSLLIILGDHGESFADNGFVGGQVLHNGRFEASQLQTLCAGRIPGHASERISHATGHADLPATILSVLHGRDLAYGHGSPLWNGDGPRLVSGANYDEICLIAGDQWLRLGAISVTRDRLVVTGPDGFPLAERGPWQPDAIQRALAQLAAPRAIGATETEPRPEIP